MIRVFCAMEREKQMVGNIAEVIGINATNIPPTTKEDVIINIGLCGANNIKPGTVVCPKLVMQVKEKEIEFGTLTLSKYIDYTDCITSNTFVEKPILEGKNIIYDMELFKLTKIPHKRLYAIKIVSDNLNERKCESFNDKRAWKKANKILKKIILSEINSFVKGFRYGKI